VSDHDGFNWAGVDTRRVPYAAGSNIYRQGEAGSAVLYVQQGTVRLSVASPDGKEAAVVELLGPGDFFGEGCLAGQLKRRGTATAVTSCTVVAVGKREMARQLRVNAALSRRFLVHVLARNIRIEEDLLDYVVPALDELS
jgi:CRP-like cAMP-binding protein